MIPTFTDPDTGNAIAATYFWPGATTHGNDVDGGAEINVRPRPVFYGSGSVHTRVQFSALLGGGAAPFQADYDIPFVVTQPTPPDPPPAPPKAAWVEQSVFAQGARRVTAYLVGTRSWQPLSDDPPLFDAMMALGSVASFSVANADSADLTTYSYEVHVSDAGDVSLYGVDAAPLHLVALIDAQEVGGTLALEVDLPQGADIYGVSTHVRSITDTGPIMALVRCQGDTIRTPAIVPGLFATALAAIAATGAVPAGGGG